MINKGKCLFHDIFHLVATVELYPTEFVIVHGPDVLEFGTYWRCGVAHNVYLNISRRSIKIIMLIAVTVLEFSPEH